MQLFCCLTLLAILPLEQAYIVAILIAFVVFLLILLILGIRRSRILQKENDELHKSNSNLQSAEDNERYENFRNGHLYDNN